MSSSDVAAGTATEVRPFSVEAKQEDLDDLRRRLTATRWPDKETDPTQGVQLETIQALADYWASDYDWRAFEERFAALPHFITEVDGVDIHFIHARSEHEHALPLIVTHGWPGSTIEQLKLIDPLTNPTENGGSAGDAFHLVIPSLPGHGFSANPTVTGWDPIRIAKAWVQLMERLGYADFVAQGGDWGNAVTEQMALLKPPGLLGIHTNMPATLSPEISTGVQSGEPAPAGLSADEKKAYEILVHFFATGTGYAAEMANRPQTLYGTVDSPVGLAAWMVDHDQASYRLIARAFDGKEGGLSRDDVLDNVTHYWLTTSGISSARLYWESHLAFFDVKGVEIPVGVSVFPDELYPAPRSWAEKAYPKLIHFNDKIDEGGHFAAWEQPQILSEELRNCFRSLR
jgi:pimeloyl-ACP methyl ester carboxylesterase